VEHLLGDLDIVGDESDYEVIEHLDELDACTEDTAKAKAKARVAATLAAYAAAKIKASVAQELTPALIGPQAIFYPAFPSVHAITNRFPKSVSLYLQHALIPICFVAGGPSCSASWFPS
jgi:hypothetical protein